MSMMLLFEISITWLDCGIPRERRARRSRPQCGWSRRPRSPGTGRSWLTVEIRNYSFKFDITITITSIPYLTLLELK